MNGMHSLHAAGTLLQSTFDMSDESADVVPNRQGKYAAHALHAMESLMHSKNAASASFCLTSTTPSSRRPTAGGGGAGGGEGGSGGVIG